MKKKDELSIQQMLRLVEQHARELLQAKISEIDLTPRQAILLGIVGRVPDMSHADLCRRSGMDRSTASDVIMRMVHRGLLQRARRPGDARAYEILASKAGIDLLPRIDAAVGEAEEELLRVLPASTRLRFVAALGRIVDDLEADGLGVAPKPRRQ